MGNSKSRTTRTTRITSRSYDEVASIPPSEIMRGLFRKFEKLLDSMEEQVRAFQAAGMQCKSLSALTDELASTIEEMHQRMSLIGGPSYTDWSAVMELLAKDLANIKEQSLRKLGEACCKSKDAECRDAVLHVLGRVKEARGRIEEASANLDPDVDPPSESEIPEPELYTS